MINQKIAGTAKSRAFEDIIPHIVQTACSFKSSITFVVDNRHVNAKSIMGVMALAGSGPDGLEILVDGEDEKEAMKAIAGLLA